MVTRDLDGYTIRRNRDVGYYYLRHAYLVDGYNVEGDPEQGMWAFDELGTCKNKKEALALMRRFKDRYAKVCIWDEWIEEDIDARYGTPILGDVVSQTLEEYVNGKLTLKTQML